MCCWSKWNGVRDITLPYLVECKMWAVTSIIWLMCVTSDKHLRRRSNFWKKQLCQLIWAKKQSFRTTNLSRLWIHQSSGQVMLRKQLIIFSKMVIFILIKNSVHSLWKVYESSAEIFWHIQSFWQQEFFSWILSKHWPSPILNQSVLISLKMR